MTTTEIHNVVNGPSKFDLMLGLFDSKAVNARAVAFQLQDGRCIEVVVNAVSQEDGSGESWNIEGRARRLSTDVGPVPPVPRRLKGYYSTQGRKGWLRWTE